MAFSIPAHTLSFQGSTAYGYMATDKVFTIEIAEAPSKGFAGYGTVDYGIADFDDLSIESSGRLQVIKPSVSKLNSVLKEGKL